MSHPSRAGAAPRVIYIDHCAQLSGAEIALVRMIEALGSAVRAHVILGEPGPLADSLRGAGATVEIMALDPTVTATRKDSLGWRGLLRGGNLGLLSYIWRLRARLRRLEPDIVHTNSLKAAIYGGLAARLAGTPAIWHVHDRIAEDYLPAPAVLAIRALARRLPDLVLFNSHATANTMPRVRGEVVWNPVAIGDPHGRSRDETSPFTIGMVGRLAPWKGQHIFMQAFAKAFPRGGARAVIVGEAMFGDAEYGERLHELVREHDLADRIEFTGFAPDVAEQLQRFDVLVHCSTIPEPFGQVVAEGMAAGLPVVAAAAGGPAEMITDGVDGLLVQPSDVEGLADALRSLHADPERRHRLAAAARAGSGRFAPDVAAAKLTAAYDRVLTRRAARRVAAPARSSAPPST